MGGGTGCAGPDGLWFSRLGEDSGGIGRFLAHWTRLGGGRVRFRGTYLLAMKAESTDSAPEAMVGARDFNLIWQGLEAGRGGRWSR